MARFTTLLMWLGGILVVIGLSIWVRQTRADAVSGRVLPPPAGAAIAQTSQLPAGSPSPEAPSTLPESPPRPSPVPTMTLAPGDASRAPAGVPETEATIRAWNASPTPGPRTPTATPPPPAVRPPSRIVIPAIGVDTSVIEMGWSLRVDGQGNQYSDWNIPTDVAGWHLNSALPGHPGNVVISGHHNIGKEVFRYLKDLKAGDHITVYTNAQPYEYIIEDVVIVKEQNESFDVRLKNASYMAPTTSERLTLITCHPYSTNTHRVIVVALPITASSHPISAISGG